MDIRRKMTGIMLGVCVALACAVSAKGAVEIPKDLVQMKPFKSTAKAGFATKNDVTIARNAYAKVQAFRNVSYAPVGDWMFDPKFNAKTLKPETDESVLTKVKLPYAWGKDSGGIFRTKFTMPETVNGYSLAGGAVALAFEGSTTIDVYIDGKRVKSFTGSGELELTGKIKPGESVTLGVKVTDLRQDGRLGSVRVHALALDAFQQPADEILARIESARCLFDQLPTKQKSLLDAVTTVAKETDKLKGVSDIAQTIAALEKMKALLAPVDEMVAKYPVFNAGPYLQNVTQNEITVAWETRIPAPSTVYYGKDALTNVVSDPTPVLFHKVVIKGLEPQTVYKYMAVTSKLAAPESTFKTAIRRDTPFKFVVWADDQSNPQIFEPLVDLMIERKPDIGISVGDEVGNGSEYQAWAREFFYPLRRLIINTPFFVAIGNHEYGGSSCGKPVEWFEKYMALPDNPAQGYYYAVTYGNSRFIMLNQQAEAGCNSLNPASKQFAWLLKEFESEEYKKADFHFMFFHKPPYSECWSGGYYDGEPGVRENIVPLIEKYKVDMVFSGHTHDYEHGQWPQPDGPHYIITGGAGGGLDDTQYKDWPQIQMYKFVHHFSFISIDGKKLTYSAIDSDNKLVDTFKIEHK
ncbi:MAG: metallophosphoesterase family protein [bacterium]